MCWSVLDSATRVELWVRGNTLNDANNKTPAFSWGFLLFGAPGEIRTPDQVVRSHLLYPAELRVLEVVLSVT